MTADIKPYPAYKDSGVPWLGQVPEHWESNRLGHVSTLIVPMRDKPEDLTGPIPWIRIEDFNGRSIASSQSGQGVSADTIRAMNLKVFPVGTVLCSCSCSMGTVAIVARPIVTNQTFIGIVPGVTFSSKYLFYLLQAAKDYLTQIATGAIQTYLSRSEFSSLGIVVPPLIEQQAIMRYLDYADRKVRHAIHTRQQLIKLLTEQKQAIINRAVTRGLDPDVRLKPSGVPWLGDVPEHWAISRVKDEFNCLDRRRIPLSGVERGAMSSQQYDYYGASGIIDKVADFLFDDELLLIAEDGANLVLRNLPLAIIARGKFWVNNHAHILKPKQGNIEYLSAVMEMLNYQPWISGAAQPKLTQDRLMSIALAIPPRDEQDQIIANVQEKTVSLRHAIDAARREIDLLREYRTRLIADVVTGKLDVRDVPVPDDETDVPPEELEAAADGEATDPTDDAAETESGAEESA